MKIALVILHADPSRGGAERYTVDLAAALTARGHEVSLVATTFAGVTGAQQIRLSAAAPTRLGTYIRFLDALDAHLAVEQYDIVHAMLPVRRCDVYHPHAGLAVEAIDSGHEKYDGFRRPLAALANRFNRKRQHFAAVERALLSGAHPPVVLCLSEYVKATVRKHYSLPQKKLATLFNAVDLNKFDPGARAEAGDEIRRRFNIAPNAVAALMIAQDFQRKGLTTAILALPKDNALLILLVVGKEPAEHYEKRAAAAGVQDRVVFAGSTTDPYAFYRAADFFVLPTRHDPCSLVVLESLAMGVPVISTAMNGACEIMSDGVHGFVLPDPRDVVALSRCYMRLTDDSARRAMSAACLALRPRLSQEGHLARLEEIYSLGSPIS